MTRRGLPHSEILGSMPVCDSPRLIAAYHVLHRLLVPRHPPYALSSLTPKGLNSISNRSHRSFTPFGLVSDARLHLFHADYLRLLASSQFGVLYCHFLPRGSLSIVFPILFTTWLSKSFGWSQRLLPPPPSTPTGAFSFLIAKGTRHGSVHCADFRSYHLRLPFRSPSGDGGRTWIEPGTSSLSGMRSNQLSYTPRLAVSSFSYTSWWS